MRTTLTIDDDILAAAKALASIQHKSAGEVLSALAREALRPTSSGLRVRNGVPLLAIQTHGPHHGSPVSLELINQLRDDLPE